jgi:hypothetical protein
VGDEVQPFATRRIGLRADARDAVKNKMGVQG